METKISEIEQLINANELEPALRKIAALHAETDKSKAKLHLLTGKIYYRQQRWGDAMNEFNSVLDIEPNNAEAISGIEMARQILGFFNPDLFNP